MKKLICFIFVLILSQVVFSQTFQQGDKVRLDFIGKVIEMDSTTCNDYTEIEFDFMKTRSLVTLADSTKYISYTTSGNYCVYVRLDTVDLLTGATLGDTDSLKMYVKEIDPDGQIVMNDSTFITPNWATTGYDWEVDKAYKFTFDMDPARGIALYIKIQRDAGATKVILWMPL